MKDRLSLKAVGHTASLFLAVSFALCVGFDLVLPSYSMYETWQGLLPGFTWISPETFLLGLAESYVCGWYLALVWVPLYNFFSRRG